MNRYHLIACHVLWRELCHFTAQSNNVFEIKFLEQGLHNTPDLLREEVQEAIDDVPEDSCDAILLGYGLCSNGLMGVEARETRLVVMRGHDCITFLLGSKERYREYFDAHPGTYWYSPGWIDTETQPSKKRYETVLAHYEEQYGKENAQYLMESTENWMHTYNSATYVDLGIGNSEGYKAYTKDCADWLKWECDILEGDTQLMRDFVSGNWDSEHFLVVEPGERIVPSHDEAVITVEKVIDDEA